MVQGVSSQAGNPSFAKSVRPWRSKSRAYLFESKPIDPIAELPPIDLVIVANQKTTRQIERAGLYYLLGRPLRGRMLGHIEMKDPSPIEAEDNEHVENVERRRGHESEIYREGLVQMIAKERCPSLSGARWRRDVGHVARNGEFRYFEAELEQFTVNSGSPQPTFISAISMIGWRSSAEIRGRPGPRLLLFHRQKSLKPLRCQATTVAGFTRARLSFQPLQ
jgi:hypothetical protein